MAFKTIHTNYGLAQIAAAEAAGTVIQLVQMAVGDGNGNDVQPNPAQTFLARERYRAPLNQLTIDPSNPTWFVAELVIPASEGGFTIREVGLYDAASKLFAVGNVPATYKPTPAEGAFSDTIIRMVFVIANASVVQLVIDPNVAVATHSWVLNNVSAGTVLPGGLTGQIPAKRSNADGDIEWIDPAEGFDVIVWSREESQTLAAGQVNVDLAVLSTEGVAVYIEGTRLRDDEFSVASPTRIILTAAHPAGAKVTAVQNEEVGKTAVLLRANNLSDVADKSAAINNLGMSNWLSQQSIAWARLVNIPAFASRWPTFSEVTDKPATYPPSAHNQDWSTLLNVPAFASRWPAWGEVSGKPALYPPADHSHPYLPLDGGVVQGATRFVNGVLMAAGEGLVYGEGHSVLVRSGPSSAYKFYGFEENGNFVARNGSVVAAGGFDFGSSLKLKDIDGAQPYGLAEVERMELAVGKYKPAYNNDNRRRLFFVAEQLADLVPEAVDLEGVEFNGERVASVKLDQLLPVLARAIQEVANDNRQMRAEIEALKAGR